MHSTSPSFAFFAGTPSGIFTPIRLYLQAVCQASPFIFFVEPVSNRTVDTRKSSLHAIFCLRRTGVTISGEGASGALSQIPKSGSENLCTGNLADWSIAL
ncbi:hypothetical protein TWF730_010174 [Orbilia blumenaviensis]|uniref:Uncharacterized protein n=1 Tax=Orbilia blumenaviensis TaxID=1796055 RepID=A0AAV9UTT6_9PEZI